MKEYMTTLGTIMMMIAISDILIPEGGIKRFSKLAMGFMIIVAIASPFGKGFKFDVKSFEIDSQTLEESEAQYRAQVIAEHKKNLTQKIKEKIKNDSEVFVEVTTDGNLSKVTIRLRGDESEAVSYIVNELGLTRERIKLSYEDN